MRNTLIRVATAAAILTTGGAMLASAQDAPASAPTVTSDVADGARAERMHFRGDRDERADHRGKDHHRGGGHGPVLGVFDPGGPAELMEAVDGDENGTITQEEIDAFLKAQVAGADTDADGALTPEEFAPVFFEQMRPRMVDAFQSLDADGSGTVTESEINARFSKVIDRMDRNNDGALSPADRDRRG